MSADLSALVWGALMPGVIAHPVEPWVLRAVAQGVSAVCLFQDASGCPKRTLATVNELRAVSSDLLIAVDEEGGEITRLQSNTGSSFLSPFALGVVADPEVTRATGRLIGQMLRTSGIDWTFAPVADVNVDPHNPVIGVRSFGADAELASMHVGAFIAGIQSTGVIATAKHFPGHGDTHVDSHDSLPTVSATVDLLRHRELLPFKAAIGVGVGSVMTGHLLVAAIDPDSPASMSRSITTNLLRDELGFKGVIVTDALDMGAIMSATENSPLHAAVASLLAGADILCLGAVDQERAINSAAKAIFTALADGTLPATVLIAAAKRREQLINSRRESHPRINVKRDEKLVADAAERSLLVQGDVTLTGSQVDVLRLGASRRSAIGTAPACIGSHLLGFGLDINFIHTVVARSDRDLVIEVHDNWMSADLLRVLSDAVHARPDAVIVNVGMPNQVLPKCRGTITTHGIGNLSLSIAACQLTGRDPRPLVLSILEEAQVAIR